MNARTYYAPHGGHPPQTQLLTDRAVLTDAYALMPKGVMQDIVTSLLPFWEKTRCWIIARPLSGFAETFSQYIMEVQPGGGSDRAELDETAEGVLFIVEGELTVEIAGETHKMTPGATPICRHRAAGGRTTGAMRPHVSTGSARPMSRSKASTRPIRCS